MHFDAQVACDVDRVIGARVVDENNVVAGTARQPLERGAQCLRRVIRRQHDADGEILYLRKVVRQSGEYTSIIFAAEGCDDPE